MPVVLKKRKKCTIISGRDSGLRASNEKIFRMFITDILENTLQPPPNIFSFELKCVDIFGS